MHAWRALFDGKADPHQQGLIVRWLGRATMRGDVAYVPGVDGERDTLLLLGQQRVGVMIGNMATPEALEAARKRDTPPPPKPKRGTRNEPTSAPGA